MPRNLDSAVLQEVQSENATFAYLIELVFHDGVEDQKLFVTTAPQPVATSGLSGVPDEEWLPLGLPNGESPLGIGIVQETNELRQQEVTLTMDGVDQTVISAIQQNFFRGRQVSLWKVWFGNDGTISAHLLAFRGYQNSSWDVSESRDFDEKTVALSTTLVSRMAILARMNPVMCNVTSHNQMLRRSGVIQVDQGFSTTPRLRNVTVAWGTNEKKSPGRRRAAPRG